MKREEFEKIADEWQKYNTEYDKHILAFLKNPKVAQVFISELNTLRELQHKLFMLENTCFKIAEGKINLED